MTPSTLHLQAVLRPATAADIEVVSDIWHRGWRDGHVGHVPDGLLPHRGPDDFHGRVPARLGTTTVATTRSGIVGFVMLHGDEVEQMYVDTPARGTGIAAQLLAHGEVVIGERHDRAWLAVVAGNVRARRFYERNGWAEVGAFDNPAWTTGGVMFPVPALRYEKRLTPAHGAPTR
jgi:GNAT superfamily N-acetyltransferase